MQRYFFIVCLLFIFAFASDYVVFANSSITENTTNTIQSSIQLPREEFKNDVRTTKTTFRDDIQKRRDALKRQIESRRETLKKDIQAFRDQKKAELAQRLNDNLNKLNENRVERMTYHIEQMEKLLTKLKDRVANAKTNGTNTTAIEAKIVSVDTALANAKSVVIAQAAKDYSTTSTSETTARSDFQRKRQLLSSDLKSVHEKLKVARETLSEAISFAYSTLGKDKVDSSTTSTPLMTTTVTPTRTITSTITVTLTPTGGTNQ